MDVLVIGGSYFVGRAITEHLVRAGHDVCILNRGSRPVDGTRQLSADRDDPIAVMEGLGGRSFDWVVDTSCLTGEQARIARGILARRFGRWVHLSSASVYVEDGRSPMSESQPVGRSAQWGDYGRGKLDAESAHAEIAGRDPAPVAVLRPPYVYGPGNAPEREHWLWPRILRGRPVLLPGDGSTPLQLVHADDLARAVVAAAEAELPDSVSAFNVAPAGEAPSFRAYVGALGRACGAEPRTVEVPWRKLGVAPRDFFPFRDYACVLDGTRFTETTGWSPSLDLDAGLAATFAACDREAFSVAALDTAAEDDLLARLGEAS